MKEGTTYLYFAEGGPTLGTLQKYAEDWRECEYSGFTISPHVRQITGDGVSEPLAVHVHRHGPDEDDYLDYVFVVPGNTDIASCRIDGRA